MNETQEKIIQNPESISTKDKVYNTLDAICHVIPQRQIQFFLSQDAPGIASVMLGLRPGVDLYTTKAKENPGISKILTENPDIDVIELSTQHRETKQTIREDLVVNKQRIIELINQNPTYFEASDDYDSARGQLIESLSAQTERSIITYGLLQGYPLKDCENFMKSRDMLDFISDPQKLEELGYPKITSKIIGMFRRIDSELENTFQAIPLITRYLPQLSNIVLARNLIQVFDKIPDEVRQTFIHDRAYSSKLAKIVWRSFSPETNQESQAKIQQMNQGLEGIDFRKMLLKLKIEHLPWNSKIRSNLG